MIEIAVLGVDCDRWLEYQSHYRCVMPKPEVIDWMTAQGFEFRSDWNFEYRDYKNFFLTFSTREVYVVFLLGWG